MDHQSRNRTVVVTGASSGIGLGVAESFLSSGANVVLNGRDETKLVEAADRFNRPDQIAILPADIGASRTGKMLVDLAIDRFGGIDVLVNNAGHFISKPFGEFSEDELDGLLTTHLKGMYLASQAAAAQMREQGGGAIVSITTVLALRGNSEIPASGPAAAKGAMNALTRSLAIELAPHNIRVNAVAPGIIKTPIYGMNDAEFETLNSMQPLGRVGEVKDVVDAVRFLADAGFVTGVVIPVDGGVVAGR